MGSVTNNVINVIKKGEYSEILAKAFLHGKWLRVSDNEHNGRPAIFAELRNLFMKYIQSVISLFGNSQ